MTRAVPEWVGKTADTPIPSRVRLRVAKRFDETCQGPCNRPRGMYKYLEVDHVVALVNWTGEGHGNRESNLTLLCDQCHKQKTKKDVALKALANRKSKARLFKTGPKTKGRPVPGSKASPWARRYNRQTGRWETVKR